MTTDPSHHQTVKELFLAAMGADESHKIAQVLEAADCDAATRCEVEKLLSVHAAGKENLLDQAVARLASSPDQGSELEVGTVVGSFTIRESIGQGGMGTVYAAEQTEPVRRKVALKIIRAAIATNDVVARFEAERQAIAMMDHPHIAKVLEAGKTPAGQPYLAMELVQGLSITKYADARRLTTDQRLRLFEKVCLAVRHAHQKGIIHRDLKPSNILVAHIDDAAVPKIIDFGLAKAMHQPLTDATVYTRFSRLLGTPMYMSPEQAELGVVEVDTRSDVYSLGVILYELLAGVPPFDRQRIRSAGFDELRHIVCEVEPCRPSQAVSTLSERASSTIAQRRGIEAGKLRATLKGELDWIVLKALEKDRERRYDSASELARDIRRYLNNQPIEACPPSKTYRLRKYVSRNRWPLLAVTAVFAALLATSSISLWQVRRVHHANQLIAAREQRSQNLLEAMRFREAVEQVRGGDLAGLTQRLQDWSRDVKTDRPPRSPAAAGLTSLLQSAATIPPLVVRSHPVPIHDLAVTRDGQHALTVDDRGDVLWWDLRDPGAATVQLGTHAEPAHAVAISPDEQQAVTGGVSGSLRFWDLQDKTLLREVAALETGVETLQYSPNSKFIAAGARYSGVWVGDNRGELQFQFENDHRHETLLFTPDGAELLVPTTGSRIHVWSMANGKRQRSFDTGLQTNVRAMCFAGKDQRWLVVGNRFSDSLVFIDRQSGRQAGQVVTAAYPRALTASPDGLWLAASYADGRVCMVQLSDRRDGSVTGQVRYQFQAHRPTDDSRLPLQWLASKYKFVSAGSDGRIAVWSRSHVPPSSEIQPPNPLFMALVKAGRERPYFFYYDHLRAQIPQLNDHNQKFYFPKGRVSDEACQGLLAFGEPSQISIVSLATGKVVAAIPSPFASHWWVELSPDGEALIAGDENQIAIWTTSDAWHSCELVRSLHLSLKSRPLFADGHRTAVLLDDEKESMLELAVDSGEIAAVYPVDADSACLSHDERWLALANRRGIRVIDRQNFQLKTTFFSSSAPKQLRFFPDDRVLLSVNSDGSICGWHIATGQALGALYAPSARIGEPVLLQIAEDGRRVLACYESIQTRIPVILGRP